MIKISDKLIDNYLNNFYGYGEWDSDYWLIGMEEACDFGREKIEKYMNNSFSREELVDNCCFQYEFYKKFFESELQPTWKRIIQVLLFIEKGTFETDDEKLKLFQFNKFGRKGISRTGQAESNAIIEFLPLPVKKNDSVSFIETYGKITNYETKKEYQQATDATNQVGSHNTYICSQPPANPTKDRYAE